MPSAKSVLETLRPYAEVELAALMEKTYEELVMLPEIEAIDNVSLPKEAALTTYRDILPDGRVQIVVQLVVRGMLGSARIWAKVFYPKRDGTLVKATDEELYSFF